MKISIHENGSDMLIKILSRDKLVVCHLKAGLVIPPKLELGGDLLGYSLLLGGRVHLLI